VGKRSLKNRRISSCWENWEKVIRQKNNSSFSDLIGRAREKIVEASLWYLTQTDASFLSYSMTTHFTRPDINGIDAFVVCLPKGASKRIVIPISVTGFMYVGDHLKKHPQIPVIAVSLDNHNPEYLKKIISERNPSVVILLMSIRFFKKVVEAVRESIIIYIKKNT